MAQSPNLKEIREWVQLGFVVLGGLLGFIVFRQNIKQRRLENALKLVSSFRESQEFDWIKAWRSLFFKASGLGGAKVGEYISEHHGPRPISDYFSEGSPDNHGISKITENLEIVCHEVCNKTVDARYIWFELGQIMLTIHDWISHTPSYKPGKSLLETSFPSMNQMFRVYGKKFKHWPTKRYEYIE